MQGCQSFKLNCTHGRFSREQIFFLVACCLYDALLTLGAHARGLQQLSCVCVCVSVCLLPLICHLTRLGVKPAISVATARTMQQK